MADLGRNLLTEEGNFALLLRLFPITETRIVLEGSAVDHHSHAYTGLQELHRKCDDQVLTVVSSLKQSTQRPRTKLTEQSVFMAQRSETQGLVDHTPWRHRKAEGLIPIVWVLVVGSR